MNFDLNIENYDKDELIQMFELPENFNKSIVDDKESKLRENILNNREINKDTIEKTLIFLMKAKQIILYDKLDDKFDNKLDNKNKQEEKYIDSYNLTNTILDSVSPYEHPVQLNFPDPKDKLKLSNIYPGTINSLQRRLLTKTLVIDSRFRDNYNSTLSTNYNIVIPANFNNVISMSMTSIIIPSTYYIISDTLCNNFFTLTVSAEGGTPPTETAIIIIPNGNYDQFTLITAINTQLQSYDPSSPIYNVEFSVNGSNGTNDATKQLVGTMQTMVGPSTTVTPGITITSIDLNFQNNIDNTIDTNTPLQLKLGWILGFRNSYYTNNLNYISEAPIDIFGPRYVYLVLDDYNNSVNKNVYGLLNSSIAANNILSIIPISLVQAFTLYIDTSLTSSKSIPREYLGPVNLKNFSIQLVDEYSRIIDLNNMDWSFTLEITCVYDF